MCIRNLVKYSVVDPDPVGYETFSRIQIRKKSSKQLRIWNKFAVKLLWKTGKIWQFLTKKLILKI